MAHYALEAADRVAEEGISVEVVDLRTLRPLDKETVLDSVRKTGKCLVVYEDNRFGGYGAEVAAIVAEEAFDYLDGPVTRIAGPDVPGRAVQPRPRGLVHGQPREDRRRHPQARRVLGWTACRSVTSSRPVDDRLRAILVPYASGSRSADDPGLVMADRARATRARRALLAGTRVGARTCVLPDGGLRRAELARGDVARASPRMQGKSCFNFSRVDEGLFTQLAGLTARGAERWGEHGPSIPPR